MKKNAVKTNEHSIQMNQKDYIKGPLSGIKREVPFKVPEGYFNEFPARLQQRIQQEAQAEIKPRGRLIQMIKPALSLAAGFAAIIVMLYFPITYLNNRTLAENGESGIFLFDDFYALVHQFDDDTFYSLLENGSNGDIYETDDLADYLVANYTDYDFIVETKN